MVLTKKNTPKPKRSVIYLPNTQKSVAWFFLSRTSTLVVPDSALVKLIETIIYPLSTHPPPFPTSVDWQFNGCSHCITLQTRMISFTKETTWLRLVDHQHHQVTLLFRINEESSSSHVHCKYPQVPPYNPEVGTNNSA